MFRCSRCDQSRWVHVRFGTLAKDLERLTGWTPYWCQACERRGWHHSRSTPTTFDQLRRQFRRLSPTRLTLARFSLARFSPARFPSARFSVGRFSPARFLARFPPARLSLARFSPGRIALKNSGNRVPAAVLNRWLLASAGVLVFTFVLGLWMGTLLYSGPTVGANLENVTAAGEAAPTPSTPNASDHAAVESEPARETRPPRTPPDGDSPHAITAAAATTGKDQRLRDPLTATKPVIRTTTARHRQQPRRTASRAKPIPRAPAADTRTAAVTASPAPALPRFHGSLAIHSEPRGALVWVDGQIVGPTPVLLKGVRAGSRVVRVESEGYERWSSAARVVADQNTAIVATLQRH